VIEKQINNRLRYNSLGINAMDSDSTITNNNTTAVTTNDTNNSAAASNSNSTNNNPNNNSKPVVTNSNTNNNVVAATANNTPNPRPTVTNNVQNSNVRDYSARAAAGAAAEGKMGEHEEVHGHWRSMFGTRPAPQPEQIVSRGDNFREDIVPNPFDILPIQTRPTPSVPSKGFGTPDFTGSRINASAGAAANNINITTTSNASAGAAAGIPSPAFGISGSSNSPNVAGFGSSNSPNSVGSDSPVSSVGSNSPDCNEFGTPNVKIRINELLDNKDDDFKLPETSSASAGSVNNDRNKTFTDAYKF